jgi:hypothetical protein
VIEIEDKPARPICSTHGPLRWGYFTDTKQGARWVSFVFDESGHLEPHVCDDPGRPPIRWEPSEVVAQTAQRGAALARAVLAGDNPFTEEKDA